MAIGKIMASDIQPIVYKGHGQLEMATPGQSISHVIGHELTHYSEYENYAKAHNLEITSKDIDITYEYRDGKLVAVAGKAKAAFAKKKDTKNQNQDGDTVEIGEAIQNNSVNHPNNTNNLQSESNSNKKTTYSLETIKANLTAKKQQLDAKAKQEENAGAISSSAAGQNGDDKKKLEAKKEKIDKKIKQVDAMIEQVRTQENMQDVFSLLSKAGDFAVKLGKLSAASSFGEQGIKAYQKHQGQASEQRKLNNGSSLIGSIAAGVSFDLTV